MSPTTTTSTITVTTTSSSLASRPPTASTAASSAATRSLIPPRSLRKRLPTSTRTGSGISSISTPNLSALFVSHATSPGQPHLAPPLPSVPQPLLVRKGSFAALTLSSLATIPDDTESYAFDTLNESALASPDTTSPSTTTMPPLTSSRFGSSLGPGSSLPAGPDVAVGDAVDVPGGMTGDVRFVGSVAGRKGVFVGIELHREFASRGKNNGDVDGISYFKTRMPGAGIFVPLSKAMRHESSAALSPLTPTSGGGYGLKVGSQNSVNFTPPTPSLPKFSQPASGRSSSPLGKRSTRPSLSRPESPTRRLQTTPVPPRPSLNTPVPKQSTGGSSRYGSPTNKFSQSVRAPVAPTFGDPSKRGHSLRPDRPGSVGPRSVSALGGTVSSYDDDVAPMTLNRPGTNAGGVIGGGFGSLHGQRTRPASRAMSPVKNGSFDESAADEEVERLRSELEDRERQLRDQANTLADMESSLTELQTLIESPDGPMGNGGDCRDSDDKDSAQLRALLREKNEKIAMLTAEFDSHRADFRTTIDTLELASTETERVYEQKINDLVHEIQELEKNTGDFNAVAEQLKQLEYLVQELEEGLEDARRGEADARGEVEHLRGELERTKAEMEREHERRMSKANNGGEFGNNTNWSDAARLQQAEIDRKDDEIRGLKAIIHSLSQDSDATANGKNRGRMHDSSPAEHQRGESVSERLAREKLEREVSDLKALLVSKSTREAEMEHELDQLRQTAARPTTAANEADTGIYSHQRGGVLANGSRSSLRDSRGTVVLDREFRETTAAVGGVSNGNGTRSPELARKMHHARGPTLDTMPESDAYSSVTDSSTLWCEICETNGHDILTCTNMFGPQSQQPEAAPSVNTDIEQADLSANDIDDGNDVKDSDGTDGTNGINDVDESYVAPLEPVRTKTPTAVQAEVRILPNPMDSGPVAGKESGAVDPEKWCALCERDGHDSVDCPFEDAF